MDEIETLNRIEDPVDVPLVSLRCTADYEKDIDVVETREKAKGSCLQIAKGRKNIPTHGCPALKPTGWPGVHQIKLLILPVSTA